MKNIEINIGNTCNNECRFCMVEHERSAFIDFATIKKEIIKARQKGFGSIGFLGGEFTLHIQVFKIIKLCKVLDFKIIHIISNGRKYQDKKFLEYLVKNGANRFSVSIHSHKEEVEDDLTQRQGGFKEKIKGIKNLVNFQKQKLIINPISINLVINSLNYKDILETLKFFNKLGVNDFRLNFIWLHGRARQNKDLFLKYSHFLPYIDQIINLAKNFKLNISFEGIPPCLIKDKEKLEYLGESRDLNTEVIAFNNPSLARENFDWQKRKKNEFKVKHEKCTKCQFNNVCEGIWQDYIDIYGWKEFNF